MKLTLRIAVFATLAATAGISSAADVFRCQARTGITYQQVPCPDEAITDTVNIASSYPDYMAERDRLSAREAAMDARLLRRLEIDSAERIARDNRASMEAQAERDRIALQAQGGPLYIVPFATRVPHRPVRPRSAGVR